MGQIMDFLIVNPAVELLKFLYSVTGNYGWAIVIFAILVRLVTWPLNLQQMRAQKNMSRLQPQIEALRKRYKDDRQKLNEATMELYKENNVNPLGGCLPLLIQLPILIGLLNAIYRLVGDPNSGFNQSFLWLADLSKPEGVFWPLSIFFPNVHSGFPILLILMVITQFVQQQMMTNPTSDPQQQQMMATMKWMPLIFAVFFISMPAGLVLYWLVQNIVGIVLQYAFMGASGLPLPNPPWVRSEQPAVAAVGPPVSTTTNQLTASSDDEPEREVQASSNGGSVKRRTHVRSKKKRRG